jgi:SPW repeat
VSVKRLIWTDFILGLWLMISPLVFRFIYPRVFRVLWEDFILGFLIAFFAIGRLTSHRTDEILLTDWLITALGAITLINPLLYNYYNVRLGTWNNLVIGGIILLCAAYLDWNDSNRRMAKR